MNELINNLAGLLVVTSFLVVIARGVGISAGLYAIQSMVLVLLFCTIAYKYDAHSLYSWSVTAVLTKVILLPAILFFQLRRLSDPDADKNRFHPLAIASVVALLSVASILVVEPVALPLVADLKPVLAVSLAHFFIGILCIVTNRNILKQLFGYCLMENGASLMLALMAHSAPHLLEVGITIDAFFTVIIMVVLSRLVFKNIQTLDASKLNVLKG
ncbi:hydrogenase 4 membrane subunit [Vibrio variabilis]|uniref:hydrogenase 4 membrane subunit n=1 Tax=Vibrio variabilis TaxID=990271 RepID=UPI000DD59486|nr:hydrogenase 4 membrane subunit [Vibrio variabilis]